MKCTVLILLILTFGLVVRADAPVFVQQASGTNEFSISSIDGALPAYPTAGNTLIAVITHPKTNGVDTVDGNDGDTHLKLVSTTIAGDVVVEVWKARNVLGESWNFHIGLTGTGLSTVTFSEWTAGS